MRGGCRRRRRPAPLYNRPPALLSNRVEFARRRAMDICQSLLRGQPGSSSFRKDSDFVFPAPNRLRIVRRFTAPPEKGIPNESKKVDCGRHRRGRLRGRRQFRGTATRDRRRARAGVAGEVRPVRNEAAAGCGCSTACKDHPGTSSCPARGRSFDPAPRPAGRGARGRPGDRPRGRQGGPPGLPSRDPKPLPAAGPRPVHLVDPQVAGAAHPGEHAPGLTRRTLPGRRTNHYTHCADPASRHNGGESTHVPSSDR